MRFYSTVYARRTLEAGFTTIRNVGAHGGADIALKTRDQRGRRARPAHLDGAHACSARPAATAIERASDRISGAAGLDGGIVDSAGRGARGRALSAQVRRRPDQVHRRPVACSPIGDRVIAQQFTDDEMRAIVETAHLLGMKVAAHAHGKRGIEAAHPRRRRLDRARHVLDDETSSC